MDTKKIEKVRPSRAGRCGHPVDDAPCSLRSGHPGDHGIVRRVADRAAVLRVAARLMRTGWRRDRRLATGDGAVMLRRDGASVTVAVRAA